MALLGALAPIGLLYPVLGLRGVAVGWSQSVESIRMCAIACNSSAWSSGSCAVMGSSENAEILGCLVFAVGREVYRFSLVKPLQQKCALDDMLMLVPWIL